MKEKRENTRFQTLAKVKIMGIRKSDYPLVDLSVTGCRVEFPVEEEIMPNNKFKMRIVPESASKVAPFNITVESKWVRVCVNACETGFSIVEPPKGKQFQRYVDYISWRYSQGKSMIGIEC